MSWLFSRKMMDEYMPSMSVRIQTQAKRAEALLDSLPAEEQRSWEEWASHRAAVQRLLHAIDQGWLLEDVLREASLCKWQEGDPCPCNGYGDTPEQADTSLGMRSPHQRAEDRQSTGKPSTNGTCRTLKDACKASFKVEEEKCGREVCVSLRYLQELAEEYSAGTSLDGGQFAQLNVMPTLHKFWRNDKTIDACDHSRFGLTSAVLMESHGEALLTSFLEAFPARTFQQPAAEPESKEHDRDYGSKWQESSMRFDPHTSCWKTHLCLWEEDLQWSLVILPRWGLMRNGVVFQHLSAERPITVTGSGLLPTPRASMGSHGIAWCRARTGEHRHNLEDYLGWLHLQAGGEEIPGLNAAPDYVEWLMMWPSGWTDLKPLEMDKFREWQQLHSAS